MRDLATFHPAMLKAMDWAEAHGKQSQIVKTQSDEDGNFSASLHRGSMPFTFEARRFNESLWDLAMISLTFNQVLTLQSSSRLGNVLLGCPG